jgi:hypothetical protein
MYSVYILFQYVISFNNRLHFEFKVILFKAACVKKMTGLVRDDTNLMIRKKTFFIKKYDKLFDFIGWQLILLSQIIIV